MSVLSKSLSRKTGRGRTLSASDWFIPITLIVLSLIPVIAGAVRLTELSVGAEITSANARFFASPIPVLLHIISVTLYSILGAFQFSRGFRRWKPKWHRRVGWALVPSGLVSALSGLWMSQFYALPEIDGQILYLQRLVFGWGMVACLVLAIVAVRQRNFNQHGAWMIRAYAIGLGAGTQVFTHISLLFSAEISELSRAIAMGAGWLINIIVAEWIIQRYVTNKNKKKITGNG